MGEISLELNSEFGSRFIGIKKHWDERFGQDNTAQTIRERALEAFSK